jgi:small subunit ribosomal protein S5
MDTKDKRVNKTTPVKKTGFVSKAQDRGGEDKEKSIYAEKRKLDRGRFRRSTTRAKNDLMEGFEQRILDIARVTRVMAGGKRMRFRACVAIGNKKGKVAIGLSKGADVTIAVTKAVNRAKKNIIDVPICNDSIPHEIYQKFGAAKILLKPARRGKGVIAGGVIHVILGLAGIKNITTKILGTNNKVNVAKCTIEALKNLKRVDDKNERKKDIDKLDKKEKGNHTEADQRQDKSEKF